MTNRMDETVAEVASARCPAPRPAAPRLAATAIMDPPGVRAANEAAVPGFTLAAAPAPKLRVPQFRLEFDDGSSLAVRGSGLIGRDPAAAAGESVEHLVALADDGLSLSRTHLEFGIGESGLWVRDRASTNGSAIEVAGRRTPMEPGLPVGAPSGCTIHMGARRAKVRTIPGRAVIGVATIDWGVASHVGAVRGHNQDAYCTQPPVFVVADGMGGHAAGDVASREAVEALSALVGHDQVTDQMLTACMSDARARIGRIAVDRGRPPGTTLSGVIVTYVDNVPSWMVVNIGDSRTYCLDSNGFRQVSIDHSVVQELIHAGAITKSAARSHPIRNALTRALLAGREHPADKWLLPITVGDRILVCSDGLTREVEDTYIAGVLRAIDDPQVAADELAKAAMDAGGRDDVTVLVIDAVAVRAPLDAPGSGRVAISSA
jgi:serine/threonine protein phosphatase PrpC